MIIDSRVIESKGNLTGTVIYYVQTRHSMFYGLIKYWHTETLYRSWMYGPEKFFSYITAENYRKSIVEKQIIKVADK